MIEVNINPEDINKAVSDAIIASAIGNRIKAIVEECLKGYNANNALERAIRELIGNHVAVVVNRDYSESIKAFVASKINEDLLSKVTTAAWEAFLRQLEEARRQDR